MRTLILTSLAVFLLGSIAFVFPYEWLPQSAKTYLTINLGPPGYKPADKSAPAVPFITDDKSLIPCNNEGRKAQEISGVQVSESLGCAPDNPYLVAASVKGTNNVDHDVLMRSGLAADAVEKGRDLDGDGDPDEIHIRLEVAELNGFSPDIPEPATQFSIAPGVKPGFWVFTPKGSGMSTENFLSNKANPLLRLPSPSIRVEQGDRVFITLENSHYLPHTIHFHGVDHPYRRADGMGNDGVPSTSNHPIMPGEQFTYEMSPRQAGTMLYHCHVQVPIHVPMGLIGMFVVEENRPNNWVQTFNVGGGHVRASSVAVKERYDREYDLFYQDIDKDLNNIIQVSNDPRIITDKMHVGHDVTQGMVDYFTVNGLSFPYTLADSLVIAKKNEQIKLRVANGGGDLISLHTHGHKPTLTHRDGISVPEGAMITRDVFNIGPAQRIDLSLSTVNNGLQSYGEGIWLMHDHREKAVSTAGVGPGGGITAIAYESLLKENGLPDTQGMDITGMFDSNYYSKRLPMWAYKEPFGVFAEDSVFTLNTQGRLMLISVLTGLFLGVVAFLFRLMRLKRTGENNV